jgi:hypothetical protein
LFYCGHLDPPIGVFDKVDNFFVDFGVELNLNAPIKEDVAGGAELLLTLTGLAKWVAVKRAFVIRTLNLWVLAVHHATP